MAKQIDPTRTILLRRQFVADMVRRFKIVSKNIQELIVDDDALGLITKEPINFNIATNQQVEKQAWRFQTNTQKIKSYRKWLQQQFDAEVLTSVSGISDKPWLSTYIESSYKKGVTRSYTEFNASELASSKDFYEGGKAQFLIDSFSAPEAQAKIELLYTRAFTELEGITKAMDQQMSRILADGLTQGYGINKIARNLRNNVTNLTNTRAKVLARTEIVRAHAEGQLDAFERLGVEEVGIQAEWITAGDDRVCQFCAEMEGTVWTIEEARGLIPAHPNCRCAWIPASKTRKDLGQKRGISPQKEPEIVRDNTFELTNKHTFNMADLTDIDKKSILEYQSGTYGSDIGGFSSIQHYLREGRAPKYIQAQGITSGNIKTVVDRLDKTIVKSVASKDMTVLRGVRNSSEVFQVVKSSDIRTGLKFTEKGFTSTTTSKSVAKKFTNKLNSWEDPKLLHINIPKDSKAFPIDSIEAIGEKEVVLPRGSEFIITKIQGKNIFLDII